MLLTKALGNRRSRSPGATSDSACCTSADRAPWRAEGEGGKGCPCLSLRAVMVGVSVALAQALQLTNILRDIEEDLANGQRIYLPLEDLARFHYNEQDLSARVRDERFLGLMAYEAARAEGFFREAAEALPVVDRRALLPARIMGGVYQHLLEKMCNDHFQVFEKRYRVSKPRKLAIFSKYLLMRSA